MCKLLGDGQRSLFRRNPGNQSEDPDAPFPVSHQDGVSTTEAAVQKNCRPGIPVEMKFVPLGRQIDNAEGPIGTGNNHGALVRRHGDVGKTGGPGALEFRFVAGSDLPLLNGSAIVGRIQTLSAA